MTKRGNFHSYIIWKLKLKQIVPSKSAGEVELKGRQDAGCEC
jgi:hypothetical protein